MAATTSALALLSAWPQHPPAARARHAPQAKPGRAHLMPCGRPRENIWLRASAEAADGQCHQGLPAEGSAARVQLELEGGRRGIDRVTLKPEGYEFHELILPGEEAPRRMHYIRAGDSGPALVLVHGFGASAYHWRYNIPELAKRHRVFAPCLLGFGWSDKALVDYSEGKVWVEQLKSFIQEVIGPDEQVVLAGNSLGGFASLAFAGTYPGLVRGVILLNAAGNFDDPAKLASAAPDTREELSPLRRAVDSVSDWFKRGIIAFSFQRAKERTRIKQVLEMVYVNSDSIDEELIDSIAAPADDPNASEVFYRVINQAGNSGLTMNQLFSRISAPVLLLWGDKDPWVVPSRADKMQELYPADRINLDAGHCPHDDSPEAVNKHIAEWVASLRN